MLRRREKGKMLLRGEGGGERGEREKVAAMEQRKRGS